MKKFKKIKFFSILFILAFCGQVVAQENAIQVQEESEKIASKKLVSNAWEASGKGDLEKLSEIVQTVLDLYGEEAIELQAQLNDFPERGEEDKYSALNDVATCLFIKAEALMQQGKTEDAIALFQEIVDDYSWSQAWDPRGWYWSVLEKSQASIDKLTGKTEEEKIEEVRKPVKRTMPKLHASGTMNVIDYKQFGEFTNVGTSGYRYKMKDPQGLGRALGEGIYPNTSSVYSNPSYKKAKEEGRLEGSHWDFVHSEDLEAAFFKWVTAPEAWGVKLFYIGIIFEKAQMYHEAIKAYQAIVVHFPKTTGWTYWQTPWYPAQAAVAKIRHIIRVHPDLNLNVKWMNVKVENGFDNDIDNDIITTFPGLIKKKSFLDRILERINFFKRKVALGNVKRTLGNGRVHLAQYENNHWQLIVDGKPYVIKGIMYSPTKIGQSPDKQTLRGWMTEDNDNNGKIDGPYDSWVDENRNNKRDADEPIVGDFKLLKEMGVNTIREYHHPLEMDKKVLREMYEDYGIRVIMGDFLGKYTLGSGASWFEGTDYENKEHQKKMMESVKKMVMEHKDEPYILMWLLGNENNYGVASNADKNPEAYFKFANEVAKMIKSIDKNHPVALCNGDTLFLDIFAKNAPDIDVFSANVYRGDYGFGSYWEQVGDATGKPAFITEYGAPAYVPYLNQLDSEQAQANYHKGNWLDISDNLAGNPNGVGNALGGVAFEWLDEWWKSYEPTVHDRSSEAIGPFPGGYYYEEWFGIAAQGDGKSSPFLRHLRRSYFTYKELWN